MKNKGRKHKANSANCKGHLMVITRPIESMKSRKHKFQFSFLNKYYKRKWHKRVRSYYKSELLKNKLYGTYQSY